MISTPYTIQRVERCSHNMEFFVHFQDMSARTTSQGNIRKLHVWISEQSSTDYRIRTCPAQLPFATNFDPDANSAPDIRSTPCCAPTSILVLTDVDAITAIFLL